MKKADAGKHHQQPIGEELDDREMGLVLVLVLVLGQTLSLN